MLCPRRYDDQVPSFDILIFAVDSRFTDSGCEREGLVDCMDLSIC